MGVIPVPSGRRRSVAVIVIAIILLPTTLGLSGILRGDEDGPEVVAVQPWELDEPPDWLLVDWVNLTYAWDQGQAIDDSGNIHIAYGCAEYTLGPDASRIDENATVAQGMCYLQLDPDGNRTVGPVLVSENGTRNFNPHIAVDGKGRASLVWNTMYPGVHAEVAFARVGPDGTVLVESVVVSEDDHMTTRPRVAVDAEGDSHIVHTTSFPSTPGGAFNWELGYSQVSASGEVVVENRRWGNYRLQAEAFSDIAIDSQGILHVVNQQFHQTFLNEEIHYRRFSNNGLPLGRDVRLTHIRSVGWFPRITIGPSDNLHVAWYDNALKNGRAVWYLRLGPGGVMRQNPIMITNESSVGHSFFLNTISMDVDSTGNLYVAWWAGVGNGLYFNSWDLSQDMDVKDGIRFGHGSYLGEIDVGPDDRLHSVRSQYFNFHNTTYAHVHHEVLV